MHNFVFITGLQAGIATLLSTSTGESAHMNMLSYPGGISSSLSGSPLNNPPPLPPNGPRPLPPNGPLPLPPNVPIGNIGSNLEVS